MFAFEGATDPAVWGEFFGKLGPGGFALVVIFMGVIVISVIVGGFLLFWRGSSRLGFKGFGEEYQKTRIALETQAAALVQLEADSAAFKAVAAKYAPIAEAIAEAFGAWLRSTIPRNGAPPRTPPPSPSQSSIARAP